MSSILKTIDCIECSMARLSHSEKNKKNIYPIGWI